MGKRKNQAKSDYNVFLGYKNKTKIVSGVPIGENYEKKFYTRETF